jgi:hypothetical protein
MKDSMIDKNKPLWKVSKADKQTKAWYKKKYGLVAKEVILPTDEYFDLLERLYGLKK